MEMTLTSWESGDGVTEACPADPHTDQRFPTYQSILDTYPQFFAAMGGHMDHELAEINAIRERGRPLRERLLAWCRSVSKGSE